tara:strand:- start:2022 stop:2267 length:246 start_codon:yes stop_codon:yes gene_type:complete
MGPAETNKGGIRNASQCHDSSSLDAPICSVEEIVIGIGCESCRHPQGSEEHSLIFNAMLAIRFKYETKRWLHPLACELKLD